MISEQQANDFVGRAARIRVHSGAQGLSDHVMAEGRVFAYANGPMIGIEDDGGARTWWLTSLPIVEVEGAGNPAQMVYDRAERMRQLLAAVDYALVMWATGSTAEKHQARIYLQAVRDRTLL